MPRRASSGIKVGQVVGIGAAIVGFLVAAVLLIKVIAGDLIGAGGSGGRNLSNASELSLSTYMDNANSLRGNVYRVSGRVDQSLKWTADRGRLISLEASGTGSGATLVPVLIPEKFSSTNIDRGAELTFIVRVDRGGLLVAEEIDQG